MGNGRKIGAALCVAVFLATGCGKIAEKAVNKAAEKATGCKDINAGNGSVNCQGVGVNIKGDGTVPPGFPSELDPPKGAKIYSSSTTGSGVTKSFTLSASVPGDAKAVAAGLKAQFKAAHYTIGDDSVVNEAGTVGGSISAQDTKWHVTAVFGQNPVATNDDNGTYVTMEVHALTADESATTTTEASSGDSGGSSGDGGSATPTTQASSGGDSGSSDGTDTGGGFAAGTSLPDGFPKDLAPPSGAKIVEAVSAGGGFQVIAGLDGTVAGVYAAIKQQVKGAGYTITTDTSGSAAGISAGTLQASNSTYSVTVLVTSDASGTSGKPVLVEMSITKQ